MFIPVVNNLSFEKSMCITVFDLTNFKAEDAVFFLLLHFFFILKEFLKKNRMKNNFKAFFLFILVGELPDDTNPW